MLPFDIFPLLNLYYIAIVVVLMEFLKKFIPATGAFKKNVMVLVVAFVVALVFVGVEVEWGAGDPAAFAQQLFLSYLAATTFYAVIVKSVLSFLGSKTPKE